MKRPCEMSLVEWRAHKNAIQRAWIKKNPKRALELSRKSAAKRKAWRINNKTRLQAWRKQWRIKNRERINALASEWRRENKDKARSYTYKWRHKNLDRFKKKLREYTIKHRDRLTIYRRNHRHAKPELYSKSRKAWEAKNKGLLNAACSKRRTATKKSVTENPDLIKRFYVNAKLRRFNTCYYCQRVFSELPDIDHIVPISKGGKHAIENLCVSCPFCNGSKKDKLVNEWKRSGQQVLAI